MRSIRLLAVAGVCGVLLQPQPALASCAAEPGPSGAPLVFVGTAEGERRGYTQFEVAGVLAGPDLAPEVWVRSGRNSRRGP